MVFVILYIKCKDILFKNLIYNTLKIIFTVVRSGDRVVEGARLESGCTPQRVPRVRIPPTPLVKKYKRAAIS